MPGDAHLLRVLAGVSESYERFETLLKSELAYSEEKFQRALRITVISTLGSVLVVAFHISSGLATCLIWVLASTSSKVSPQRACATLTVEALVLVGSLIVGRVLAQAPWGLLLYLFVFIAASTFLGLKYQVGNAVVVTQVISLSAFYDMAYAPRQVGWTTAGSFAATAIAFALLVLFDNWVWPPRASALLTESIGASLARERMRLVEASRLYFDNISQKPAKPSWNSDLPAHLALLNGVIAEGTTARRRGIFLAAITRLESIHLAIDRLVLAAGETVPQSIRSMLRREIEAVVDALEDVLNHTDSEKSTVFAGGVDQPPSARALRARSMWDAFSQRQSEVRPLYIQSSGDREIVNFASFTDSLANLVRMVQRPLDAPIGEAALDRSFLDSAILTPQLVRHWLKVGLSAVVGYIIGLTSQRPELSVILATIVITALPTYGASVRKLVLRIIGAILGGLICLLVIFVITPNSDSVSAYLAVIVVVFFLSAYSSLSSGRIAYAGNQMGTTFALAFAGLSPATDVYDPLWRIWGILLGTLVVTFVFLAFWADYAGDSLLPRLQLVINQVTSLLPGRENTGSENDIETSSLRTMAALTQILEVAEDARLEGRKCTINHDNAVQAAEALLCVANRLGSIAIGRINAPPEQLDESTNSAHELFFALLTKRLEEWSEFYGQIGHSLSRITQVRLPRTQSRNEVEQSVEEFANRIEANGFRQIDSWSLEQRRVILSEIQALRRLEYLLFELDRFLYGIVRLGAPVRT
ncbi:MAG: FUSC family protein [Candidatus Eremiobacteraeota bacterium]|nr:FUSC family protein [Candidatus Eremiobacteraeota bacterium]